MKYRRRISRQSIRRDHRRGARWIVYGGYTFRVSGSVPRVRLYAWVVR